MNKIYLAQDTISSEELSNLADWIKTNKRLTKGPLCLEFEKQFALWQGSNYAVFVNSGSSANLLIAQALCESKFLTNKRVIVPAVSWCTTVTPFIQLGFEVSLCDCDSQDLGFDIKHFEQLCIKQKPSLAVVVNVLGHPNKMDEILEICKKYNVLLIEDSCEALGSVYTNAVGGGGRCGSIGFAGSFSFYYGHHISTIEGGMVVTDNEEFYNLLLSIRSHGWGRDVMSQYHDKWTNEYNIDEIRDLYTFYYSGFNLRSTDLNAFLGISQLKKIDEYVKIRKRNYELYSELLSDYWKQTSKNDFLSSFAYGVLIKNRVEVFNHLLASGIENRPLICGNIGLHPFWIKKYGKCNLPMADIVHNHGLYLPNHAKLTQADIEYICKVFKEKAIGLEINK